MYRPSLNLFAEKAEHLFRPLITEHGYELQQTRFNQYSVQLIYLNKQLQRSVKIENAIHGYDYGFSIFIKDIDSSQEEILLNLPNEKQDSGCKFLEQSASAFFGNPEVARKLESANWQPL